MIPKLLSIQHVLTHNGVIKISPEFVDPFEFILDKQDLRLATL